MINYIEGDLFANLDKSKKICMPHVCNCLGKMGSGFVIPLAKHFPKAKEEYLNLGKWELGTTQFVNNGFITVANMIAQTLGGSERPLFYNYLVKCMEQVTEYCHLNMAEIVCPLFGSGLAKGDPDFIEELMIDCWIKRDISVTVYYLKDFLPKGWSPK